MSGARGARGPLLDARLPLVAAPMAGGPTTVALAAAAASAGAFPMLAAGNKDATAMAGEIAALRAPGPAFGVNLFVPSGAPVEPGAFRDYVAELQPEADRFGVRLDPAPQHDDDAWHEKLALLLAQPVPVVSLTFGLPGPDAIAALRDVGTTVLASVTSPAEAVAAARAGVDGLVVQGAAAGGHSAVHDPAGVPAPIPTAELVRLVRASCELPLVAAGGVDGPAAVRALLDAGAEAVAVGTMLLRTDEAGTSATHRAALADPARTETVITRAFTGRPARSLRNAFIDRHDASAPTGYPAVHRLTSALRRAAAAAGDAERVHLWAGTGFRSAPTGSATDVIAWLAGERSAVSAGR